MPCSEWKKTAPIKDRRFGLFFFLRTKKHLIILYTYTRVPGVFMMFHGFHFGINPSWTLFKHHIIQIMFVTTTSVLNRIQYNNSDMIWVYLWVSLPLAPGNVATRCPFGISRKASCSFAKCLGACFQVLGLRLFQSDAKVHGCCGHT